MEYTELSLLQEEAMGNGPELDKKFNLTWSAELAADLDSYRPRNIPLSRHVRMILEEHIQAEAKGRRRSSDKLLTDLDAKQKMTRLRHEGELNDKIQLRISESLIAKIRQQSTKKRMNQSQYIRLILSDWVIRQLT